MDAAAQAPVDPRQDLPAFGTLPPTARVDPCAVRVIAPNPSPMTLDGTNTYVLFEADGGGCLVLDPGPDDDVHLAAVEAVLTEHDLDVTDVVVTHHHVDHAEAAHGWAQRWSVEVVAARPDVAGPDGRTVAHGDELRAGGLRVTVVATPGHTEDSLSLRLPSGAVCTGDHVLGRGTTVVAHPDGTLEGYLESLRTVLDLGPSALLTGHGPALTEDPEAVLRFHQEHRAYRLSQIERVLADGRPRTAGEVVDVIYAAYDPAVRPAATASTLAAYDLLTARGRIRVQDGAATLVEP